MQSLERSDIPYKLLAHLSPSSVLHGLTGGETVPKGEELELLTTTYIVAMYHSALANLYMQSILPADIDTVYAEMPRVQIALTRTYNDFKVAHDWLSRYGANFVDSSLAKQYYEEIMALGKDSIKDLDGFYAS